MTMQNDLVTDIITNHWEEKINKNANSLVVCIYNDVQGGGYSKSGSWIRQE